MEVTFTEIGTIANRKRGPARLPDYAQELAAFHRAFERELRALVASLPIGRDMRVIDVGCGDGFYTGLFAEHLHSTGSITGFDSNADYLKMARDRLSSRAVACEVSLIQGRLERITELAGQFDVVWCAQSLFSQPE